MAGIGLGDRKLGAEVRRLTLKEIQAVLLGEDKEYKKALILKLASTVLPRINEHSGEDGGAIKIQVAKEIAETEELYNDPPQDTGRDS